MRREEGRPKHGQTSFTILGVVGALVPMKLPNLVSIPESFLPDLEPMGLVHLFKQVM